MDERSPRSQDVGGRRSTTRRYNEDVPHVTLRTVVDGREEILSEYLCDWPDCPNVAVQVVGVVRELRLRAAMCAEHAAGLTKRNSTAQS